MNLAHDLAAVMHPTGGVGIPCVIHVGDQHMPARVVLVRGAAGKNGGRSVLGWASPGDLPRGADWATALLLVESLPIGTGVDAVDAIDDQLGTLWRVEGATPLVDTGRTVDGQTTFGVIGWRLALRGTQRGVR